MAIDHKMILFAGLRWVMGLSLVLEVLDAAWAHCGESYVILLISCIHGSHGISFSVSVPIQLSFAIHLPWLLFITYSSVSVLFDSCCHEAVYFLDRVCQCSGSIGRQTRSILCECSHGKCEYCVILFESWGLASVPTPLDVIWFLCVIPYTSRYELLAKIS